MSTSHIRIVSLILAAFLLGGACAWSVLRWQQRRDADALRQAVAEGILDAQRREIDQQRQANAELLRRITDRQRAEELAEKAEERRTAAPAR